MSDGFYPRLHRGRAVAGEHQPHLRSLHPHHTLSHRKRGLVSSYFFRDALPEVSVVKETSWNSEEVDEEEEIAKTSLGTR